MILIGALVMLVTSVPYLIGFTTQGTEWVFTGFLIGVEDGNSYIAKMLSGAEGNWLFRSPYSAEPQKGVIAFLPYLLLGKLTAGAAQHEQLVVLFHLFRMFSGILVALSLYDFIALYIDKSDRREWALLVILLGGGLGWVITLAGQKNLFGSIPLDFLSPESFGFLGLFGLPHLIAARALLFWGAALYLRQDSGLKTGLIWTLMSLFQPLYALIIWLVVGLHAVGDFALQRLRWKSKNQDWSFSKSYLKSALVAGLVSCPLVFYTMYQFYFDPYLAAWTSQNTLPSPHFAHYLLAYGLVFPLAVGGIAKIYPKDPPRGLFLACWILAFPFLISAPVPTQRRLAEGIWVITIIGFYSFFLDKQKIPVYGKVIVGFLFPTTIFLIWGASARALRPSSPLFEETQKIEAYLALRETAPSDSIVLSTYRVGNSLPAWVPVYVFQGHGPETINLLKKQSELDEFFMNTRGDDDCGNYFSDRDINYLFWGPDEISTWNWNPAIKNCLQQVYNSKEYKIYKINGSE